MRTQKERRVGRVCEKRGGGWRAKARANKAGGGGGGSLDTPENRQALAEMGEPSFSTASTLQQIDRVDKVVPGVAQDFQAAINERSMPSNGTGIADRIDTIASYILKGQKANKGNLGQIGDAIGMAKSGSFLPGRATQDGAQRALTRLLDHYWSSGKITETQKNRIALDMYGTGNMRGVANGFQNSRIGRDLSRRQESLRARIFDGANYFGSVGGLQN